MTTVSVVIPTRNRRDRIGESVASVLRNDHESFDLTVVDQSTDTTTRDFIAASFADDERLRYVPMDASGAARARNEGAARSGGEIIAYLDDDCEVATDWIATIVEVFRSRPEADLVYGRVLSSEKVEGERDLTPNLDFAAPFEVQRGQPFKVFGMSANFAARRATFEFLGGFDEELGVGAALRAGEDFDLEYRAYLAGALILVRPEVVVLHHGRREMADWPALLRNYGFGDAAFYLKHLRCRDLLAARLLGAVLVRATARAYVKPLLGRGGRDTSYLEGFLSGLRASARVPIDARTRLYRPG